MNQADLECKRALRYQALDRHTGRSPAVTAKEVRHLAVEQYGETIVNYAAVADILGARPAKPVFKRAA